MKKIFFYESLRAKRSPSTSLGTSPEPVEGRSNPADPDCFVAIAPRNDTTISKILLLSFLFLSISTMAYATPIQDVVSGYYKALASFTKSASTKEGIFYLLQRMRVEYNPRLTKNIELGLTFDHELMINDFSNTSDFSLIRQKNLKNLAWLDTDRVISDTDHVYERHLFHRAFLKFESPHSLWTFGKQLIDWGRMRFYSPLDLFNQPLPSDIESDERIGFDALNIELFNNNFTGLNILYGPGHTETLSSFGLRFNKKIKTYDTCLIFAKHQKDKVAGFGFDGYIGTAGLRGEFTYTKSGKERFLRASLGLDYSLNTKTSLVVEYFYNGAANGDYAAFSSSLLEARRRLSLKKRLMSASVVREITPLFKAKLQAIYDTDGKSAFINPELSYNVRQNIDIKCGTQLYAETKGSEFEDSQNLYYIEIKLFF